MADGLRLERHGDGVVRAVLDRGEANLLTGQICDELAAWLREPPPDAHILVLAPLGPNFCLGRERQAQTVSELRAEVGSLVALNRALRATTVVTVAQVSGGAAGYGVGLAALCDVTVATPSARFWFPEVDMDLAPTVVLAWLPRLVGSKQAFLLTASGQEITAAQAAQLGLVAVVAPSDDALEPTVRDEVAALTKRSGRVHGEIKTFLRGSVDLTEDQAYDLAVEKLVLGSMARRN